MKKLLLSILTIASLTAFSQWQSTSITSTGFDCISAFGNVYASGAITNACDVTTNDGATWTSSNTGYLSGGFGFGTFYNNALYACQNTTILVRTSASGNWSAMTNTFSAAQKVKSMTALTNTVMAAVNNISTGTSWRMYEYNGSAWVQRSANIAGQAQCIRNLNGTIFAGTTNTYVLKSTDGGVTYTNSSIGITGSASFDKIINCLGATSTAIFAGTQGGKIWKSVNNGANWTGVYTIGNGSTSIDISDIYVLPNNNILVACDSGFVYSTDNGTTWQKDNTGLPKNASMRYDINRITVSSGTTPYIIASDKNGKIHRRLLSQIFSGVNEINPLVIESKVYPNPANDHATIEASELMPEKNCEVKVVDVLGREVSVIEMKNGKAELNLSSFAKGIYTYSVYNNKAVVSKGQLVVN